MTRALRRFPYSTTTLSSFLLASSLGLFAPAVLPAGISIDAGIYTGEYEALGIGDDFGRFDSTIQLVYDPDGAPAAYASNSKLLALLEEAFGYWAVVSGVDFDITGVDPAARDDRSSHPNLRDGLVRVSWGAIGGAAGQAGPVSGFYDDSLGYFPFEDGTIELNNGADVIGSDIELVAVLVHEIGHLLGLGHSDNPDSVMYANPYNFLRYPRADDIRAMQVLYGAPAIAISPDSPLPAWIYTAPPAASAATTQFLFKPNSHPASGSGAYFEVDDVTVTSITSGAADNEFVWFVGAIGGGTAVDVDARFIVVDPSGYIYEERDWELKCSTDSSCMRFISIAEARVMKTIPGLWKVHVVYKATNQTLTTATLQVNTTPTFNRAPTATLTAVAGPTPSQVTFTLTASDPEGCTIEVIWHPPNLPGSATDLRQNIASGASATQTFNFALTGTHTLFVELRDDAPRYGDGANSSAAGEGFQTLLRATVTLPAATLSVVSNQAAEGSGAPSQQVLAAVAKTTTPLLASNTNGVNAGSTANVVLTFGASSDQGATVKTNFRAGDEVIIAGGVRPLAADVGKGADIFIVVRTIVNGLDTWTYRDSSGVFVPWPTVTIATLQPAARVSALKTSEAFEIFTGGLIPAEHRIYIGYRLAGGSTLYYTGQALILGVTN